MTLWPTWTHAATSTARGREHPGVPATPCRLGCLPTGWWESSVQGSTLHRYPAVSTFQTKRVREGQRLPTDGGHRGGSSLNDLVTPSLSGASSSDIWKVILSGLPRTGAVHLHQVKAAPLLLHPAGCSDSTAGHGELRPQPGSHPGCAGTTWPCALSEPRFTHLWQHRPWGLLGGHRDCTVKASVPCRARVALTRTIWPVTDGVE